MNPAYLHLILNHLPVLGTWFGLLLLSAGLLRKSDELKKASLVVFVLCALAAVPVFLTGEPAEGVIERLPGVSEQALEAHESAAKLALVLMELLGGVSLLSLFLLPRGTRAASSLLLGTWGLALLAGGVLIYTAKLGGQVRHSEVREAPLSSALTSSHLREEDDD